MMSLTEPDWQTAALNRLKEASKKHGRLGKPKSRNGCSACKQRKVKCDEAQPECSRCLTSGRMCPGYAESSPSRSNSPQSTVTSSIGSPLGSEVSLTSNLHDDEKRQLDFFVAHAAPRLAGTFDKDFWCGSVLRAAQHEPVVLDCLLAISTLYEHPQYVVSYRSKTEERQGAFELVKRSQRLVQRHNGSPIDLNHAKALTFYNRAIKGYRQQMNDGTASPVLALVSCILFTCVETIRDHVEDAMTLFQHGVGMINHYSKYTSSDSESALLTLVRRMFLRLAVLAAAFGHPACTLIQLDSNPYIPSSGFRTIEEARLELFAVLAESNSFTIASNVWRNALFETRQWRTDASHHTRLADRKAELDSLFADLERRHDEHIGKLHQWRKAFESLTQYRTLADVGPISYLLMLYCNYAVWMPTRLSHRKVAFDAHTATFAEFVRHAESFLNHNASERPIFTFDIGALPSLYYAASECRVPSIRRKALALLRRVPKKESIMNAESSAEVAQKIIAIEERGLGLPDPSEFNDSLDTTYVDDTRLPDEDNRVHFMEIVRNEDMFALRVTMLVEEDGFFHWKVEDVPM